MLGSPSVKENSQNARMLGAQKDIPLSVSAQHSPYSTFIEKNAPKLNRTPVLIPKLKLYLNFSLNPNLNLKMIFHVNPNPNLTLILYLSLNQKPNGNPNLNTHLSLNLNLKVSSIIFLPCRSHAARWLYGTTPPHQKPCPASICSSSIAYQACIRHPAS